MDPSPGRFMSIAVSAGNSSYVHWSRKIIVYYQDPHLFQYKTSTGFGLAVICQGW